MTIAVSAVEGVTLVPLTREQYEALVETGTLADLKVELLEGGLVDMPPQGLPQTDLIEVLNRFLSRRLSEHLGVRQALPFAATDLSEPEPDLAVVRLDRPRDRHPSSAVLIIEISDSSLRKDLGIKARIYAAAGVPTYIVLDVRRHRAHVHTEPGPDGYSSVAVVGFDTPLDLAGVTVVLSDLLA